MADIFVSYAREDHVRVASLVEILEACGWSVWWDRQISSGAEIDEEIYRELGLAKCVLVIWTGHSVASRWVRGEARVGLERGIAVPVTLDVVDVPIDFRAVQLTDFSKWSGDAQAAEIRSVTDAITRLVREPPKPAAFAPSKIGRKILRQLSKFKYAAAALLVCAGLLAAFNYQNIMGMVRTAAGMANATDAAQIFTSATAQVFRERLALLESSVQGSVLDQMNSAQPDSWVLGQDIASSDVPEAAQRRAFDTIFPAALNKACTCWSPVDGGQHAAATAWVLLAHARTGHKVDPTVIQNILADQAPQGWWPLYLDAKRIDASASTYATTLLMMALHEYTQTSKDDGALASQIDTAVQHAGKWLFENRPSAGSLWLDYPNSKMRAIDSRGVSALVVFNFLRIFHDERARIIYLEWFEGLKDPAAFDLLESSDQYIETTSGSQHHDATRILVFPWELAALVGGYSNLDFWGRAKAQQFIGESMDRWQLDPKAMQLAFLTAESSYALRTISPVGNASAPH